MTKLLLSTPRLNLRQAHSGDAAFVLELMNSPDWIKNIGNRQIHSLDDALIYVETKFHPYLPGKGGSYVVALKDSGIAIGTCGIYERDYLDIPDIGFSLLPHYYKLGYAYEAASAILQYARENWGLTRVSGMVIPENTPSIRLLEKLGLEYVSPIDVPNDPEVVHLYAGGRP